MKQQKKVAKAKPRTGRKQQSGCQNCSRILGLGGNYGGDRSLYIRRHATGHG